MPVGECLVLHLKKKLYFVLVAMQGENLVSVRNVFEKESKADLSRRFEFVCLMTKKHVDFSFEVRILVCCGMSNQ